MSVLVLHIKTCFFDSVHKNDMSLYQLLKYEYTDNNLYTYVFVLYNVYSSQNLTSVFLPLHNLDNEVAQHAQAKEDDGEDPLGKDADTKTLHHHKIMIISKRNNALIEEDVPKFMGPDLMPAL